ncbi:MAG: hypothetical protein FJX60_21105 [Alphaproteobacteria bacterium]|nr:hypothetical protein [Alphaproteobacteria bacterium]
MHGHAREGAHDRPDFVRRGERCSLDGDLIRLWTSPVGGIRPNGRRPPIPWLMDLSVLEEAMRSVYGRGFRLGARAPLLQMAVDALAAGDRKRAAELAEAVEFPPPDYPSTFRNACGRYLSWGPAHNRSNPRIDVDAWLARKQLERKYDPDQPRVPRGHPDGGQWTDDPSVGDREVADLDRLATGEEIQRADDVIRELESRVGLPEQSSGLLHLAGGSKDRLKPGDPHQGYRPPPLSEEEIARHLPTARPTTPTPTEGKPLTKPQLLWQMTERIRQILRFARRSTYGVILSTLVERGFPEVATYFDEPKALEEMRPDVRVENFSSFQAFEKANPAGPGYQWHHIREQSFGSPRDWNVDATENIVRIPVLHHRRISAFYSSKPEELGGLTVRDWLKTQSPEFQWRVGLTILQWQGVMK